MTMAKHIANTCIVDTYYALTLYLLYAGNEEIERTHFFVGNTIDDGTAQKLPHCTKIKRVKSTLLFRIKAAVKWPFIRHTKIYAQDHIRIANGLIGRNKYTLIEDAPGVFAIYDKVAFLRIYEVSKWKRFKYGPVYQRHMGMNLQCVNRLITEYCDCDALRGKRYERLDLRSLWQQADTAKQDFMRSVFGIGQPSGGCDTIVFSQPLTIDCGLSDDEMADVYRPYIDKYAGHVIVKPHPRDTFDWQARFPEVKILKTKAPMQLLCAMGYDFKTAVTVTSTAISAMPADTKIIWIGSAVNEKIRKVYGDIKNPRE